MFNNILDSVKVMGFYLASIYVSFLDKKKK